MTSTNPSLSPAQADRLERMEARFPATHFDVIDRHAFSAAVTVEWDDLNGAGAFVLTAAGRALEVRA